MVAFEQSTYSGNEKVPPMVLTKDGDDLRVDLQVQLMFRVFNSLWEVYGYEFKNGQLPYCVTYRVCPFSTTSGVIEVSRKKKLLVFFKNRKKVVPRCTSLYDHKWVAFDKHRTVSSAIGAFVGGYMLGVRDRHKVSEKREGLWKLTKIETKDNILFALDTLELFHVDFGYIFNSQTKMFDAPRFAIDSSFKVSTKKEKWECFCSSIFCERECWKRMDCGKRVLWKTL